MTTPNNRGDRMSYIDAKERIAECARDDYRAGNDDQITLEQARSFVRSWARKEHWVSVAVAVLGLGQAAQDYLDEYEALNAGEYES